MRHPITIILLLLIMLPTSLRAQSVGIIPTPQHIEFRDGYYTVPRGPYCQETHELISSFPVDTNADQGYILEVQEDGIMVQALTETGLFYGHQSVKQLIRHFQDEQGRIRIPCMRIVDYPKLRYRGWMDDISRGPIVNMDFLKRMIVIMSEYKMNFFNLYTEHVFKLPEYPDIAPTDGLAASQVHELEEFAKQYHIEIFGNQQCLAHAEKTLRIPYYLDMADTKANWNPGTEQTYKFLKYQLETVAHAYSSPFFNINCDETEALGTGKAAHYVDSAGGAAQVYADHIRRVYDILKPLGKRVMMWGDIAAKDSAITAQLPQDMLMLVWSYAPSDSYADMMKPFVRRNLDFMVAPGMSMWGSVFPSYETYTMNIANLVRDGFQHGALGMMNTAWDDSGESLINSAWHGMCWAAEMAWKPIVQTDLPAANREREDRLAQFNPLFEQQFPAPEDHFQLMRDLEHTDIPNFFNSGALHESVWDFYPSKVTDEAFRKNREVFDKIESALPLYRAADTMEPSPYSAPFRIAYYVALHQQAVAKQNMIRCMLYDYNLKNNRFSRHDIEKSIQEELTLLHRVKQMYMQLWDEENRPYSRHIVEQRYDALARELLDVPNHVFITSETDGQRQAKVSLRTLFGDRKIYYTVDGREPRAGEMLYDSPFVLDRTATVRAMTVNAMSDPVLSGKYVLLHDGLGKISKLNTKYSTYRPQYAAAGTMALADGQVGGDSYMDGHWQGYWGENVDVEFDFGRKIKVGSLKTRFLQNVHDWIKSPQTVELFFSKDGHNYFPYTTLTVPDVDYRTGENRIHTLSADNLSLKTRYLRVVVRNGGPLPEWHQAKGEPSYIFCDEIIINER